MIVLMAGMRNSFPLYRKTCLHRSINVLELKPHMLASSNMYWCSSDLASHQQLGFDICFARMHVHGFDICSCRGKSLFSDSTELLMEPLQLVRGNELFKQEFVNILHALHVVQFHRWKASGLLNAQSEVETGDAVQSSKSQQEMVSSLKSQFLKDHQLVKIIFSCTYCCRNQRNLFDWDKF
uniref:Uncharacterized protein n=1 Tax=Populus trichocarpa TaxID=3694 RepID=A0A2K1R523_POPTR